MTRLTVTPESLGHVPYEYEVHNEEGRYVTRHHEKVLVTCSTPANQVGNYSEFCHPHVFDNAEQADRFCDQVRDAGTIDPDLWNCTSTRNLIPDYVLDPHRPEFN